MKRRVEKKRRSRYARSFRRRYVLMRGDHRRWWLAAIMQKKAALIEALRSVDCSLDARVGEVLVPKAKLIGGVS